MLPARLALCKISIHALREEGDEAVRLRASEPTNFNPRPPRGGRHTEWYKSKGGKEFQSTPSARRATLLVVLKIRWIRISIHALREEGDPACPGAGEDGQNFNPRPPRGGRRWHRPCREAACLFQSTPSARRATGVPAVRALRISISIHALREEGD